MKVLLVFCIVASVLSVQVNGDGHGHDASVPKMKVAVKIETTMFKLEGYAEQKFVNGVKAEVPVHKMAFQRLQMTNVSSVKGYLTSRNVSNCSLFMLDKEHDFNFTDMIQMINSSDGGNTSQSMSSDPNASKLDVFTVLMSTVVLEVDGKKYCARPEIKEEKGMKKIRIVYPKCTDFDRKSLIETVHERMGIDEEKIKVGKYGIHDDCSFVDVYFQYGFDDLQKAKMAVEAMSSMSGLGRFSGSAKCKTDYLETFITKKVLGTCLSSQMKNKSDEKELPKCAMATGDVGVEYKQRMKMYDCMLAEYSKKYGIKADGCIASAQAAYTSSQKGCSCASSEESRIQNNMVPVMDYVGAPRSLKELDVKKGEMKKIMQTTMPDISKITKIASEIKVLEEKQMDYYFKVYYGFCIIAAYGDKAMSKLQYVKERVARGDSVDDIVTSLVRPTLGPMFKQWLDSKEKEETDVSEIFESFKKRALIAMGTSEDSCSRSDMNRAVNIFDNFNNTLPEAIKKFNDVIDEEEISNATKAVLMMVQENPKEFTKKAILALFTPIKIDHSDEMIVKLMAVKRVLVKHKTKVSTKLNAWKDTAKLRDLMLLQAMFMSEEDIKKGCDLTKLAEKVKPTPKVNFMHGMGMPQQNMYGNAYVMGMPQQNMYGNPYGSGTPQQNMYGNAFGPGTQQQNMYQQYQSRPTNFGSYRGNMNMAGNRFQNMPGPGYGRAYNGGPYPRMGRRYY